MKRRHVFAVFVAALLLGGASQAGAEVRLDFDIPIILGARINVADLTGTSRSTSTSQTCTSPSRTWSWRTSSVTGS